MRTMGGSPLRKYSIVDKWNMDEEFGRQYLSGCNPIWLKRCDAIPDNFAVTDKLVTKVVKGNTLAELARNGALYIADYAILANIPTYKKGGDVRYCAAPLVLFYVNGEKNLVPVRLAVNSHEMVVLMKATRGNGRTLTYYFNFSAHLINF